MRKIFITILSMVVFSISNIYANQEEFMSYEDFLFDVKDLLYQTVEVQVPFLWFDIPARTAHIDESLAIRMENIERDQVLNIAKLCDGGTNCWLDVQGEVLENPNVFPPFLIDAESVKLHFLVGYAVSETGSLSVGVSEEDAISYLLESSEGEAYLSNYLWISEPGTLVIGFGSGLTEFYIAHSFNKNAEVAITDAVKDCNDLITGIFNNVKCEPITMNIPWWED